MSDSKSLQPYVFAPFPSPQVRTVREYLKYYGEFDLQNLSNLITDNFTQQTWPQSLNAAVRTKEQEFEALKGLKAALKGQPLDVKVYNICDEDKKTWVHLRLGALKLEGVYLFQFGAGPNDAHKIIAVREFVDSKRFLDLNPSPPGPCDSESTDGM